MQTKLAYRAELWDVPGKSLRAVADGALVVQGRRIVDAGPAPEVLARHPGVTTLPLPGRVIVPGFVDAHVHFPQIDIIGASGEQLLGWLQRYTYPHEMRFGTAAYAQAAADRFVTELLANGTTTAAVYTTSHLVAAQAMLGAADRRGLRAIVGKVSMDRDAPEALLCPAARDLDENERLIAEWHGRDEGRIAIALTPRFALSCSEPLMAGLGALAARHGGPRGVYVQTHHAENPGEIAAVHERFPGEPHYLGVYERFGLVGPRTILGHSVHATDAELDCMAARQAAIAHCPTSNAFLGSGLFALAAAERRGVRVALGSDVGGGTSFSPLRTMDAAYKIQKLRGNALTPARLLRLATQGGAEALGLGDRIGSLDAGKDADLVVLDWRRSRLLRARFEQTDAPEERLGALITLGDDRLTERVLVAGREVYAVSSSGT